MSLTARRRVITIVFCSRGGIRDVYRVDLESGAATRVTTDPAQEWPGDWRKVH